MKIRNYQLPIKQCNQCKYRKYDKENNNYYCSVIELDEDVLDYWNKRIIDEEDRCYGFNNEDIWY